MSDDSGQSRRVSELSPRKRALLLALAEARRAGPVKVRRRARPDRLPLTFGQQRLWLLDRLQPGSAAYNQPYGVWLEGALDRDALLAGCGELVRRHEALRTTFTHEEGSPRQVVHPELPPELCTAALAGDAREAEAAALSAARELVARPFDLARGPLLRVLLARVEPERHLLVLIAHHIAIDGWSLGTLMRELSSLYEAFAAGRPSPLPEPELQLADYALYEQERLGGHGLAPQLAYWQQRLAGCPGVLDLPGDHPRPALPTGRGGMLRRVMDGATYQRLQAVAREHVATPAMVAVAAFQALLHRLTGQSELVVGCGFANRQAPELEPMVGFLVNTLPLRADFAADPTFGELLAATRTSTLEAFAHPDAPLHQIAEALQLPRSTSHAPLVQAMLFFQSYAAAPLVLPGLAARRVGGDELHPDTARADLVLAINEDGEGELLLEWNRDLFDTETAERLLGNFLVLLAAALADPGCRVGRLALLTDGERADLARWNATQRAYPAETTVHGLVAAQARRTPDAVAATFGERDLTYAELAARAGALAAALVAHGVEPGERVGLFVERSLEMLVGLLGILEAGAAYVPLDPSYPGERLGYMLADAGVRRLVTQRHLLASLPPHPVAPLVVDLAAPLSAPASPRGGDSAGHGVGAEELAYVIYTSGSTGRPKGVAVRHHAAVNLLRSVAQQPGLAADDALLAVSTLSFDIHLLELVLPLTVGARVLIADGETVRDGLRLARLLDASGATVMQATPATWRMLLAAGWRGKAGLRIISTGEALPPDLAVELASRGVELWNLYGPTETTVYSTLDRVPPGDGPVAIGRPVDNTQIHVVDRHGELTPVGVPGELLIAGDGLARGYLGRPDLTADRFRPDPFSGLPGARLYRSGDLARWRRDGRLEVLGRLDHQVKLRGFRIELGEVEAALAAHAAVRQAVVACREDRPGDPRLVAYVVTATPAPGPAELRAHLRLTLPDYMVPAFIVALEALPLTPNGKVDRRALPAPETTAAARPADPAVELRSEEEAMLAAIWERLLGVERVGTDDDFFALGGHSLLATQLAARIERAFGIELPLFRLFAAPRLGALAAWVAGERAERLASELESEPMDELLAALEGLSEEEANARLAVHQEVARRVE